MLTNLGQEKYKDDNGREIEASAVDVLGPYKHIAIGFYRWTCGRCGEEHGGRSCGWPISGQVMLCGKCSAMNLLVRTNCVEIDEALSGKWRTPERDAELERLRGVVGINDQTVRDIKQRLLSTVSAAISNWRLPIELQREAATAITPKDAE